MTDSNESDGHLDLTALGRPPAPSAGGLMSVTSESRPKVWRLARIGYDRVRDRPVLLFPEGAMFLNQTGKAILELCDGQLTVGEIAKILDERYNADVLGDVVEFLSGLERRDLVVDLAAVTS